MYYSYVNLYTMQHQYKDIVEWYQNLARDYSDIASLWTVLENQSRVETCLLFISQRAMLRNTPFTSSVRFMQVSLLVVHHVMIRPQAPSNLRPGEWISGAVCMYFANYLCENYGRDTQVTDTI